MNTPATHPQCPAGDRPEGGLLPTSGRDTVRIGDYALSASTSGAFPPCWASDTSPAASAAGAFTEAHNADKLAMIRTLSLGEIEGWRAEITGHEGRPFNGETAALTAREKQLKGGR